MTTTTYSYNGDGIRVQQASSTSTTNYVIDGSLPFASVAEDHDGGNSLTARYIYGDDLLRMDRTSGEYYYIYDGLGSIRQLVNASGTFTDTYSYDAFGDLTSSPQPTPNPFLFNGQDMDGATGLIYLRARYMNPEDGRFLSQDLYDGSGEDPISLHRYLYASDDPVYCTDPSGDVSAFAADMERQIQDRYAFDYDRTTFTRGTIVRMAGAQFYDGNGWVPSSDYDGPRTTKNAKYPDIFDYTPEVWTFNEIKPLFPQFNITSSGGFTTGWGLLDGIEQINEYKRVFGPANQYSPGFSSNYWWKPSVQPIIGLDGQEYYVGNIYGVLVYYPWSSYTDFLFLKGLNPDDYLTFRVAYLNILSRLFPGLYNSILAQPISDVETEGTAELATDDAEATTTGVMSGGSE